jgi:hypothetical protein
MQPSPIAETVGPVSPRFRVFMVLMITDGLTDFNFCQHAVFDRPLIEPGRWRGRRRTSGTEGGGIERERATGVVSDRIRITNNPTLGVGAV